MSCIGLLTLLGVGTTCLHDMSTLLMMGNTGRQAQPLLYNEHLPLPLFPLWRRFPRMTCIFLDVNVVMTFETPFNASSDNSAQRNLM